MNLKIDENTRNVLGAVTNDPNEIIQSLLVNPITGALLVEADVLSTNTNIGSTILGGTAGSVLFLDIGSTLGEDNANFFWDATNRRLGLLTDTPTTTFDLGGKFKINSTGNILRINNVPTSWPAIQGAPNSFLQNDGLGNLSWTSGSGAGYEFIQNQGVGVTSRTTINLSNLLTATDNNPKTDLTINTFNLANDSTFITSLVANTTFLSDLANSTTFVNDLIANTTFTTNLANNSNFINTLTSNSSFITNVSSVVSGKVSVVSDGMTIIGDGTVGNPLVAIGGGGGGSGTFFIDQTPDDGSYALLVGSVDGINQTFTVSQGSYVSGKIQVFLNGLIQLQGNSDDWKELSPASGTIQFNTAPLTGSIITVVYQTSATIPIDEKVKVDGSDTTPGFLDPKLNIHSSDSSVTVTKTITGVGNEVLDYDLMVSGGASPSNPLNVTVLDDFNNLFYGTGKTISGNFTGTGTGLTGISELNHPGIISMNSNGTSIVGFSRDGSITADQGLMFQNDFDITILARMQYTGGQTLQTFFILDKLSSGVPYVRFVSTGAGTVFYNIGGGEVVASVTFPPTNTWFKVRFTMVSGTFTIYLDSNVLYTGTPGFTGPFSVEITDATSSNASQILDVDYVLTNYKTIR